MTCLWEALLVSVIVTVPVAAQPATSAQASKTPVPVSIILDRATVTVGAGDRFRFTSIVRNDRDQPVTGLIGHLNIAALDPDVYVDPEDWSSNRTQYVDTLPAHASTRLTWNVQAVGGGRFILYVGVAEGQTSNAVRGSPPLQLEVSQRRALNAGSVLPVAVSVPAVVLVLMAAVARRRRRLS